MLGYNSIVGTVPVADSEIPPPRGYIFPKGYVGGGGVEIGFLLKIPSLALLHSGSNGRIPA
jgi:hypothetical protein